ncbi:MAG: GntR family transcriptional regulator [Rhabdaerophilum calidifontis]
MVSIEPSKTQRLYLLLKDQILSGVLPPGHRLPSEPDLAVQHRLSRVTVRRALDGLAREGLIRRQPGAGTFVLDTSPRKSVIGDLSNMLAHLVEMGRTTRVRLVAFRYGTAPAPVVEALRLAENEIVQHAVRVRYIDDTPFSHLTTYVPERIGRHYSEAELASTPLLARLARSGIALERAVQTFTATLAGPEIAAELGVEVGAPLLAMTRAVHDSDGRGVEYLSALYRPDKYAFQMEMSRTGIGPDRRWSPSGTGYAPATGRRAASQSRRRA